MVRKPDPARYVSELPLSGRESQLPRVRDNGMVTKRGIPRVALFLGAVLFVILVLVACGTSLTSDLDPAPDFQFSLYQGEDVLGGTELKLSDLRGKPLVLNFWAGLCPPCRLEMPDLQEFYDEYGDRVNLFGLDVGPFTGLGSNRAGKELLVELGISYPAGTTQDGSVVREYEILGMPTTVFITGDGKIFRRWGGLLNREKLVEITQAMFSLSGLTLGEARESPGNTP